MFFNNYVVFFTDNKLMIGREWSVQKRFWKLGFDFVYKELDEDSELNPQVKNKS